MGDKVRSKEELNNELYNYYICFGIDPALKKPDEIEAILKQKRNMWTQGTVIQRRYMELWDDMNEVMVNDAIYNPQTGSYQKNSGGRKIELENAKKIKLDVIISSFMNKAKSTKRILQSDIDSVYRVNKQFVDKKEIEDNIKAKILKGNPDIVYIDDTQKLLDFKKYKEINQLLNTLSKTNLYEFLEISPGAKITEFPSVIDTIYKGIKKKTTPEGQAADKLCGHAKQIFKTQEEKNKYDIYISLRSVVWDKLEGLKSSGINTISMNEFIEYINSIKNNSKLSNDDAKKYLYAGLVEFKLTLEGVEPGKDSVKLEQCPHADCGKLYTAGPNIKSCPHCGKSLIVSCWNCGGMIPLVKGASVCPTCSSTDIKKKNFDESLSRAQTIINKQPIDRASLKNEILNMSGIFPDKNNKYYSYKKIVELEEILRKADEEEEKLGKKYRADVEVINKLLIVKNCCQARDKALLLRRNYGTYNAKSTNDLIARINLEIEKANNFLKLAQQAVNTKNELQAILNASKALEICADLGDALQIVQKFPPQAPMSLKVTPLGTGSVKIEWVKPANASMITYKVIRKIGSRPQNHNDGDLLTSDISVSFFEDKGIVSATAYYYGVYAERLGIKSNLVTSTIPCQIYQDVTDVTQDLVENVISVKWNNPLNIKAIEVWKKDGNIPPLKPGDGTKLVLQNDKSFIDKTNSNAVSYLFVCNYDVNGRIVQSKGIQKTFKKYEILKPVENVSIENDVNGFVFTSSAPQTGQLELYTLDKRIAASYGTLYKMGELSAKFPGIKKIETAIVNNRLEFNLLPDKVYWIYPMVKNEQLFIMMPPILINTVVGIKNVKYQLNSSDVTINGTLPPSAKNIYFLTSTDHYPRALKEPGVDMITVSKDTFVANNGYKLQLKPNTLSYVSIIVELESGNQKTLTAPVFIDEALDARSRTTVRFAFDYTINDKKNFKVKILFSSDSEITLPKLVLVRGIPKPLSLDEGKLVDKIENIKLERKGIIIKSKNYKAEVVINCGPVSSKTKFALFVEDRNIKYVDLKQTTKENI